MDSKQQEKMKQMDPEELEMLKKLKANNWKASKQGVYPSGSTETNGENAQGESGSEISGGVKSAEKEKTAAPQAEFSKNAEEVFLKAIGVTKKPAQKSATKENNKKNPGKKLVNVVDDSKAAEEAALKELLYEINKLNANPVLNPALHKAAFKYGIIKVQQGINNLPTGLPQCLKRSVKRLDRGWAVFGNSLKRIRKI
ncbi:MAG: hypothetical protein RR321_07165 [Acidaminococcaceae bacterium]